MQRLQQENRAAILKARRKHAKTCSNDAGYDLITVPKVGSMLWDSTAGQPVSDGSLSSAGVGLQLQRRALPDSTDSCCYNHVTINMWVF